MNVAHARKKKRLDEEMEALLAAIETRRRDLEDLDRKIEACNERARQKEDHLKQLERQLVEVLVGQQKSLLRVLIEAGNAHARYLKERDTAKDIQAASSTTAKSKREPL